MSIFSQIRKSCEQAIRNAEYVWFDDSALENYSSLAEQYNVEQLSHTEEHHLLGCGDTSLCYFLLLDTINFGSGYFPFLKKSHGNSGYFTIAKSVKEYVLEHGFPDAQRLSQFTYKDTCDLTGQDETDKSPVTDLLNRYVVAINNLGDFVLQYFDGDFVAVFEGLEGRAETLVNRLRLMPLYNDVNENFGREIIFLKRAQILVQDIVIAEPRDPRLQFVDINELTAFADNLIPYIFRVQGFLHLHPELEELIESEVEIATGSAYEIELRAASIVGVERIHRFLRDQQGIFIPPRLIDFMLWHRAQQLKKVSSLKRHRTRSDYY